MAFLVKAARADSKSRSKTAKSTRDFKPRFDSLDLEGLECRDAAGGILAFGMAVGLAPLIFAEDSDVKAPVPPVDEIGTVERGLVDTEELAIIEPRHSSGTDRSREAEAATDADEHETTSIIDESEAHADRGRSLKTHGASTGPGLLQTRAPYPANAPTPFVSNFIAPVSQSQTPILQSGGAENTLLTTSFSTFNINSMDATQAVETIQEPSSQTSEPVFVSHATVGVNPMQPLVLFETTWGTTAMMSVSENVYVLDWNDGLTLSDQAVEFESEGDTLELRAQVQGKEVSSYSWDLTNAPTATDVTGSGTQRLQLNWKDIYDPLGETDAVTNEIKLTIDYTDLTQDVQTYTFEVMNDGTAPFGFNGGGTLTSASWDEVLTPDKAKVWQSTVAGDGFAVSSSSGELLAQYGFVSYGPASPGLGLAYQSEAASPNPMFIERYEIDPTQAVPDKVSAKLTFNGVAGNQVYYDTSNLNPGDIIQIPLQADASSLATGRYDWDIEVIAHYSGGDVTTSSSGKAAVLNKSGSEVGNGWWLAGANKIHELSDGALLDFGGQSLWFEWDSGSSSYISPDGDFSTLVKNGDGTFTRTLFNGEVTNFDDEGKQTDYVDKNGNTTTLTYDANDFLIKVTDANGRETTLDYISGLLTKVTDPAGRETTFTYDANDNLESITDPGSSTWDFEYDSSGRMTKQTDPLTKATSFSYTSFGRIDTVTLPDTTSITVDAIQVQGLPASGLGSSGSPADPLLAVAAFSTYVDGNSESWQKRYDWYGYGATTQAVDPLGYMAASHLDADGLTTMFTDTLSRNTVLDRDSSGNVTAVTHADYSKETYEYNSYNQVTKHTDTESRETVMTYDSYGNLLTVTNPLIEVTTFTYTSDGKIETVTDDLGNETSIEYDSYDRPIETTLPDDTPTNPNDNPTVSLTYDSAGNVLDSTDPLGNVIEYGYDDMGRTIEIVMPDDTPANPNDNPKATIDYDARGRVTTTTDPDGKTVVNEYDSRGRVTKITDQLNNETTFVYDAVGNQTEVTNALNETTEYDYDAVGNVVSVTDAEGAITYFTFDPARQLIEQQDPLGNVTSMAYNSRGWLSQIDDPAGGTINKAYSSQGWLEAVAHYGTPATTYEYDDMGRVVSIKDPLSNESTFTYDDVGNLTSKTDPLGHSVTYTYDEQNRLLSQTDELNNTTSYTYDLAGNLLTVTDPLSRTTTYTYDEQNRALTQTDPETGVTSFAYDIVGRLTSVTDAEDNETTFAYDAAGRLLTETDPLGYTTDYTYDALGRMVNLNDRNDRDRAFEYDLAGRQTAEKWLDSMGAAVHTIDYTYNDDGLLTQISDPFATYAYTYDDEGKVTSVDNLGTPNMPNVVLTYTYDDRDNLTTLADNIGGGSTTTFTYDDADRMTSVAMDFNPKVNFTYDAAGRITYINRTDQSPVYWPQMSQDVNTTISYDDVNRVTGIHHQNANLTTLAQYTFTHNAASELTQEVSSVDGTVGFSYDDTGQLTSATGARSESYSYDLTGNRTMTGYSTGTGNRLTSDGTYNYTYDNEGNRTSKTTIATGEVVEYSWDYRNRLVEVVFKDSGGAVVKEADFVYDPFDKLIGRIIDPDGAGSASAVETWTLYHGPNAYADFDVSGALQTRYMHGNAIDMLLARVDPSDAITWYLTDHLGTVRDLADGFGNVIDHIEYDSFGNIISETNPSNGDRFKFTGREWEDAVDLYYYRARWYDPAVGRFVTQDPIGFEAGDANLYRYVGNGPSNRIDPTGMTDGPGFFSLYAYYAGRMWNDAQASFNNGQIMVGAIVNNAPAGMLAAMDAMVPYSNDIGSMAVGFIPYMGEVQDGYEVWTGTDAWSGQQLTMMERGLTAAAFVIPFVPGRMLRGMYRATTTLIPGAPRRVLAGMVQGGADLARGAVGTVTAGASASIMDRLRRIGWIGCFVADTQVVIAIPDRTYCSVDVVHADDGPNSFTITAAMMAGVALAVSMPAGKRKRIEQSDSDKNSSGKTAAHDLIKSQPTHSPPLDDTLHALPNPTWLLGKVSPLGKRMAHACVAVSLLLAGILLFGSILQTHHESHQSSALSSNSTGFRAERRAIQNVEAGDLVVSRSEHTGRTEPKPVVKSYRRLVNHLRILRIRSDDGTLQTLKTTDEHPFRVATKGWVRACALESGQTLVQSDGSYAVVLSSVFEPHAEGVEVFNLHVADYHTYFIAAHGSRGPPVWVHNTSGTGAVPNRRPALHGTDSVSGYNITNNGLNQEDWLNAAGGAGPDPKGFSVTTDPATAEAWAEIRARERGGTPVVLEANPDDLPLRTGQPGEWADPDELYIAPEDFPSVGPGVFRPR